MTMDLPILPPAPAQRVVPIGELARRVASLLERSFPLSWVSGEVSNLTRASSGHWYFSMKDRDAQVRCVMFRVRNQNVDWMPRDGDRIEARVLPGLYVPRGDFQLQVEQMRRAGAGVLFETFLRIKAGLEAEGLFAAGRKKTLPRHPRTIGVVTSLQAAALRDVLTTLARRSPHVEVIVFPTPVQGQDAAARIVEAIVAASHPRHAIDVLLIVRGGGSIEDLWAFNDEHVARAIAATYVPVVSGVGHETDFTIADFVADTRAPTPTAAAELASPDASALAVLLTQYRTGLDRATARALNGWSQRVDEASRRLRSPGQRLDAAQRRLDAASRRLMRAQSAQMAAAAGAAEQAAARLKSATRSLRVVADWPGALRERLSRAFEQRLRVAAQASLNAGQRLTLLDPKGVLQRGYAIATDADGRVVRNAAIGAGQRVIVEVADGRFATRVVGSDEG